MKRKLTLLLLLSLTLNLMGQDNFKDLRMTYLWDVTLSMKGLPQKSGNPDIWDEVKKVMIKDIMDIDNPRTEIVVVPFQDTKHLQVWRTMATEAGKASIIKKIKNFDTNKMTNTCISAPLQFAIDSIFTPDRIDNLKLMTDGNDNVNPQKLTQLLNNWCAMSQVKDVRGYYILLTDKAANNNLSLQLKETCNFEEVDAAGNLAAINQIVQLQSNLANGLYVNIRDDYNKPKRIDFTQYMGKTPPTGYRIHFRTQPNPYIAIDTVVALQSDNSATLLPRFLASQQQLMDSLPIDSPTPLPMDYLPEGNVGTLSFVRLVDTQCTVYLVNKPEKTVRIYVKQK